MLTVEDAWELGFDHFVVAVGAGLPKALPIPSSMAPGMRQANDFLMALQLGNAAKTSSVTNLQIRLPAVVIGGGLTGVDTATELQAYYMVQVEKILTRYEILQQHYGEEYILKQLDIPSSEILAEYLAHGKEVRAERERAKSNRMQPDFIKLARKWGGVTIAYRRSMQESPAYINNHEELKKALEEGIYYLEGLEPKAVLLDDNGFSKALVCYKRQRNDAKEWVTTDEEVILSARSILVATGTQPNTAYEFEHRGTFNRLNLQYQHYEYVDGELSTAHGVKHCKDTDFGPFTSYHKHHKQVSLIGDTHPVFHGNVVKAIASGFRTYPKIIKLLKDKLGTGQHSEYQQFAEHMQDIFQARIFKMNRKTDNVIELKVRAPIAARHFKPGQFYRLQNFETYATKTSDTLLQMEPLALVTAECDANNGILTFLITENTAAAKLVALLKQGEPVSLMGPTGVRTKIPSEHETILILGQQNSFSFLRSVAREARHAGNRVLYVCVINQPEDIYCQEELENSADSILWLTKSSNKVKVNRQQDYAIQSPDCIAALIDYAQGKFSTGNPPISLNDVDRVFIIGNPDLLRQFQNARINRLKEYLVKDPKIFGSVYGNMQCMLKGVCAQCLQWQIDPATGQRTKAVFVCSWQDQPLEIIDIEHAAERQMQNHLSDQLSKLWVDHVLNQTQLPRV